MSWLGTHTGIKYREWEKCLYILVQKKRFTNRKLKKKKVQIAIQIVCGQLLYLYLIKKNRSYLLFFYLLWNSIDYWQPNTCLSYENMYQMFFSNNIPEKHIDFKEIFNPQWDKWSITHLNRLQKSSIFNKRKKELFRSSYIM